MTGNGWRLVAMADRTRRRGLWMRGGWSGGTTPTLEGPLEICSGREGDDAAVTIRVGDVVTGEMLGRIQSCLDNEAWVFEDMSDDYHPTLRPDVPPR